MNIPEWAIVWLSLAALVLFGVRIWMEGVSRTAEGKERGKRRKYGGDVWREGREFYDIILGKREGGRREEKKRGRIG